MHCRRHRRERERETDLPPALSPFTVTPFVRAPLRYFFPPLSQHASHPDNAQPRSSFDDDNNDAGTAMTGAAAVVVCIASPQIRFTSTDVTGVWESTCVCVCTCVCAREEQNAGRGEKARPRWCCARADRWGVKPPIRRPARHPRACRTPDISITARRGRGTRAVRRRIRRGSREPRSIAKNAARPRARDGASILIPIGNRNAASVPGDDAPGTRSVSNLAADNGPTTTTTTTRAIVGSFLDKIESPDYVVGYRDDRYDDIGNLCLISATPPPLSFPHLGRG